MVEQSGISIFLIAAHLGAGGSPSYSEEADRTWVAFDWAIALSTLSHSLHSCWSSHSALSSAISRTSPLRSCLRSAVQSLAEKETVSFWLKDGTDLKRPTGGEIDHTSDSGEASSCD